MQDPFVVSSDEIINTIMHNAALQHAGARYAFSNKIRRIQWRNYFSLQLIRYRLSHFPPGMITLIPASRWLFDNFHLLYRNFKSIQANGDVAKFSDLPIVRRGSGKGFPSIYLLAREMIACTNHHLTEESVVKMMTEYQKIKRLTSIELALFPDILVFCLLEKVIEEGIAIIPAIRNKANADRIMKKITPHFINGNKDAFSLLKSSVSIKDMREHTFSSHLIYRLKSLSLNQQDIINFLADVLRSGREGSELLMQITEKEKFFEAESESRISSLITSLDEISGIDSDIFISTVSPVDLALGKDPENVYSKMNRATRARYRDAVVRFAKQYRFNESEVAQVAVNLANTPPKGTDFPVPFHVGTYLVSDGVPHLKSALSGKPVTTHDPDTRKKRWVRSFYFIGIILITLAIFPIVWLLLGSRYGDLQPGTVIFYISLFLPASGMAVYVMNSFYTRTIHPVVPLSMNFDAGIPESCKTFVVMPVILTSPEDARSCVAALEQHYLVNRMEHLFFAILLDFKDAAQQTLPEDALIIDAAVEAISMLNHKHPGKHLKFSLFYRERLWNESENCWMGWERKRGKIEDFNALLAGEPNNTYKVPVGAVDVLQDIKYVITLDSDTELTNGSAVELIGVMEHPLNRPVFDNSGSKILSGYVIVQSEVRNRVHDTASGMCQKIFSGQSNFDPYATIVSDVYQDTFEEGIYAGKGIYNLQAFHQLLYRKIPDNHVLSHDLLEGSFTRCAFASGIKLMNSVPTSVEAYVKREHRWVRGDWQLLPFIFRKSEINMLSRWKMLDNLRRSLIQPAQIFLLVCAVFLIPQGSWIWLPFLFYEAVINIISVLGGLLSKKIRHPFSRVAFPILWQNLYTMLIQAAFFFILLPTRAYQTMDAILRTLYRLLISRHKLLEWQTAEDVQKKASGSLKSYFKLMIPSVLLAVALFARLFMEISNPGFYLLTIPAFLWMLSPVLMWLASRPGKKRSSYLPNSDQTALLRSLSVKIWSYFIDFSDEEHHWLCPDHLQEIPGPKLENKVSPTNIGLQLLATLSARDLGYVSLLTLIERVDRVLATVNILPKWNGHLYNWYNTLTLQTLDPQYVSTVDSGNFIAHIITLKNGLLSLPNTPVFIDPLHAGLLGMQKMEAGKAVAGEDGSTTVNPQLSVKMLYALIDTLIAEPETGKRTLELCERLLEDKRLFAPENLPDLLKTPKELAAEGNETAAALIASVDRLVSIIDDLVDCTNFRVLYNPKKHLFRIGYHPALKKEDHGHYNLMASEARSTSFLAIAKGDVSKKHWLALGRPLTIFHGIPSLVSWSGSMFEYLMPNLVMRIPPHSIMSWSCSAAVKSQIRYGRKMEFPWGVSESQYFVFDNNANYQYGPFGVSRMRLQSSLKPVKVIAPYATFLALGTNPQAAIRNLAVLDQVGAGGMYGFYEALDYNNSDPSTRKKYFLVRSFMTHHLGMSLAAINNLINDNILQDRFHSEPMVRASESLLEDTFTNALVTIASRGYTIDVDNKELNEKTMESRSCGNVNTPYPIAHVLSNGHYQVLLSSKGDGFSACDNQMISRWCPRLHDGGCGTFVYVRDIDSGRLWSNTYHPVMANPDSYQVVFSHDKAEYRRTDGMINCVTEITISPMDQLEIRRVTLTNLGERTVNLELTSYLEVVVGDYMADAVHLAYSKLFIETKFDSNRKMLIATRRAKSPGDRNRYVMHQVRTDARLARSVGYETNRLDFIGRGGSLMSPESLKSGLPSPDKGGTSLDPILSLQVVLTIAPGRSASVSFITAYCPSMNDIIRLSDKLATQFSDDDLFKMAKTSSLLEIEYLKIQSAQLNAIQDLVGALYYPTTAFKNNEDVRYKNKLGQSGLWKFGISGDLPIMLLRVKSEEDIAILRDVLLAYEYLRLQKVRTDLVILNEEDDGYNNKLQQMIFEQTSTIRVFDEGRYQSGLFILRFNQISIEERDLLTTVARIIFTPQYGIYYAMFKATCAIPPSSHVIPLPAGKTPLAENAYDYSHHEEPVPEFFNGIGGFVHDGREYEIRLTKGTRTPVPWINVIANEHFGFQISETGAGYTWSGNSRENKLTSWSNDPVLDPLSEAIYVQNDQNGSVLSPCSMVSGTQGQFYVRHGFGYSLFERRDGDLGQVLAVFACEKHPLKLSLLTLRNKSDEPVDLTVTYYAEWVLGVSREQTDRYILTAFEKEEQLMTARNVYTDSFRDQIAFLFCNEPITSFTGNRDSFIGEDGTVQYPFGLSRPTLDEKVGEGTSPCGVIQCKIQIAPRSSKTVVFGMGQTASVEQASALSVLYRDPLKAWEELRAVQAFWNQLPGDVTVRTPDRAMDILMNGWLMYQVLSCRFRARAAFYQCGGAFGFRDQLQDVLALLTFDPGTVRAHILLCCSKQFIEGDVLHWWHESNGIGMRSRISDNLLWLPYAAADYCKHTGEWPILDEQVPFLDGNVLTKDQHETVFRPDVTKQTASLYDHCVLAIDYASRFGIHGLPLIKGGDWNDGMNLVGILEQGESVWLGWFLYSILQTFIPICEKRHDDERARKYQILADTLLDNIEKNAWDGDWYLRAFFDNGDPLGSSRNEDCRIDSISQSWAILSGGAKKDRAAEALKSVQRFLVKPEEGLVLLLTPPFDKGRNNPGYIKGYNPGIRENGGQYTHAAVWLAMAFCRMKDGNEAYRILNMINPIQATTDFRSISRYQKEPYVMCADVSSGFPNSGKGGWSWYTGAAGWMYRTILGSFLGLQKEGNQLHFAPCIPSTYKRYKIDYKYGRSLYEISVLNNFCNECNISSLSIDGVEKGGDRIELIDDNAVHHVEIILG